MALRSLAPARALLVLLCVVAMALASSAFAQTFPELTGRVVDQANLLDASQEAQLTSRLEALETQSNRQFVVATVNSLEGYDIADYGYRLGREWGIGQDGVGEAEKDNGIILLVAPNDRKVRIEVGYGLEGIMTDALSSIIIQNDILPQFRDGNMAGGIIAGVDRISAQLALPEEEARALAQQAGEQSRSSDGGGDWFLIAFWLFILFFFVIIPMIRRRKGKSYRSGSGPVVIWGGGFGGSSSGSSWGGGGFSGGGFSGGGFSGGGGSFGGGGASGGW